MRSTGPTTIRFGTYGCRSRQKWKRVGARGDGAGDFLAQPGVVDRADARATTDCGLTDASLNQDKMTYPMPNPKNFRIEVRPLLAPPARPVKPGG